MQVSRQLIFGRLLWYNRMCMKMLFVKFWIAFGSSFEFTKIAWVWAQVEVDHIDISTVCLPPTVGRMMQKRNKLFQVDERHFEQCLGTLGMQCG